MMQMTDMPIGMMWGMGLICLLVVIFLLLGIAACIKYPALVKGDGAGRRLMIRCRAVS